MAAKRGWGFVPLVCLGFLFAALANVAPDGDSSRMLQEGEEELSEATADAPEAEPSAEEPSEEPAAEPPAEEAAEPLAEEPAEEPSGEPPAEEPAAEPPAEEPAEEASGEPPAEEPAAEPPAEEPAEEPSGEPPAEEPAAEPPAEEPAEEPSGEPPAEEPAAEPPAEEPVEEPSGEPPAEEPAAEPPAEEPASEKSGASGEPAATPPPTHSAVVPASSSTSSATETAKVITRDIHVDIEEVIARDVFFKVVKARNTEDNSTVTVKTLLWYDDPKLVGVRNAARLMKASDLSNPIALRYAQALARECGYLNRLEERASKLKDAGSKATSASIPKCLEDAIGLALPDSVSDKDKLAMSRRLAGPANAPLYIVMDALGDKTLDAWWRERPAQMSEEEQADLRSNLRSIFKQLAAALQFLTDSAVPETWVHHDIKPENIMIDTSALTVKLTNFGNAIVSDGSQTAFSTRFIRPPALTVPDGRVSIEEPASSYDVFSFAASLATLVGDQHSFDSSEDSPYTPYFMMAPQKLAVYSTVETDGIQALEDAAKCTDSELKKEGVDPKRATSDPATWARSVAQCTEGEEPQKHLAEQFLVGLEEDVTKLSTLVGCTASGDFGQNPLLKPVLAEWGATKFSDLMASALSTEPGKRPSPATLLESPWLGADDATAKGWALDEIGEPPCPDLAALRAGMLGPTMALQSIVFGAFGLSLVLAISTVFHLSYTKTWALDLVSTHATWLGSVLAFQIVGCACLAKLLLPNGFPLAAVLTVLAATVLVASCYALNRSTVWIGALAVCAVVALATEIALLVSVRRLSAHLAWALTDTMRHALVEEGFPVFTDTHHLLRLCQFGMCLPLLPAIGGLSSLVSVAYCAHRGNDKTSQKPVNAGVELADFGFVVDEESQQISHMSLMGNNTNGAALNNDMASPIKKKKTYVREVQFAETGARELQSAETVAHNVQFDKAGTAGGKFEEMMEDDMDPGDGPLRPSMRRYYFGGELPMEDIDQRSRHRMFGSLPNAPAMTRPGQIFGSLPIFEERPPVLSVFGELPEASPAQVPDSPQSERSVRFRLLEDLPMSPVLLAKRTEAFAQSYQQQADEQDPDGMPFSSLGMSGQPEPADPGGVNSYEEPSRPYLQNFEVQNFDEAHAGRGYDYATPSP